MEGVGGLLARAAIPTVGQDDATMSQKSVVILAKVATPPNFGFARGRTIG